MKRSLLAISVLAVVCGPIPAATAKFQFNILSVTDSNPGQMPKVVFSVTDPANGAPYDIKTHPAFTSSAVSRLTVQIGWDTADIHNTGSGSEFAATPAAGQPISVNALSASFPNGDGTFTVVFTKPIPGTATGTGMAFLEGRMAAQDVTGAYSIQAPVKGAYKYFVITGTGVTPRRQIVDRNRCNTCHTVLTVHGNQRTDELNGCVLCHNPNATDIPYRQYGDGPEVPINFEYLVHSIHRGTTRYTPFKVIGFGHSINDFSGVKLQNPPVRNCEACHLPGTYLLPLSPRVPGMTVNTQSMLTATQKTVDNDPANNLRITPTASVCSACHEGPTVHSHMLQYGAAFDVLQQSISSGAVTEQCATCHGAGKSRDIFICHNEPNPFPRLSALSVNSGVLNTSVPVTITGANLTGAALRIAGTGVTASSVVIAATQITATLNVAANTTLGGHVITVVTSGGTSEGLTFNVVPPAPVLTAIAPAGGPAGGVVAVSLRGSNLSGATLAVSGTAVTISAVSASASQITATMSIAASAAAGNVILTATTSGGLSNGVIFRIDPPLAADFAISASPSVRTVLAGASTDYTVSVAAIGGFAGSVGFTASGMPGGVTATFNPASVSGGGTSIMSLAIPVGTLPGTYPLTITATGGSLTHTASAGLTVIAPGAGSLSGSLASPPATVLLTPEGTLDWTHWGLSTSASFDHKAGVAQSISNFSVIGSVSANRYGNNSSGFTWTDGTPTVTATGSTTGLYVSGQNNGFRITVPADTTAKTLRVYVGAWRTQGRMTAELSDGSAPLYIDNSLNNTAGATTLGVYTLTYRASSAGQTLTVSFVQTTSGGGNVTLQAATLAVIPALDFTLSATPLSQAVQAGAVARYTATVAAKNGFSGTVGLGVSGLPVGVTAGFSPATVAGSGSSTLWLTTTAGTAAGSYPLTITGTNGSLSHSAGITLTVTASATGTLSGSRATPASTVQLTTEGTLDWAHWGLATATDFDHTAAVAQQISHFTAVGGAAVSRYANNSTGFSWTDGMPAASATNSATGVFISGANNGFQITVPAGAISRTLKVYVGAWHTQGRLVAHLSDGSAADYVDTSLSNTASPTSLGVYTLTFRAASDGQTLTVTFTNVTSAGNVTLQAAALAP